jgi:Cu2+-exporting ATPase
VTLIDIMLLGHWIEMRSVRQASGALKELARLMPDTAERIQMDGSTQNVPVDQLIQGDMVLVRPGGSIPADGVVTEGESDVNEAMITGESRPVSKHPGEQAIAGTINGEGSLRLRITATGDQTALAGIMRLVEQAGQSKSRTQILADRAAGWLFYIALAAAILTGAAWIIATGLNVEVVARVATVLVIACPHALGLAIPLVVAITTATGAKNGILVRDRLALERAREIDTVIFDKTGTLTHGEFGVVGIQTLNSMTQDEALSLAAAVEGDSEHTIARGIRRTAEKRGLDVPIIHDFQAIKGRGVKATSEGKTVYMGGPRMLEMLGLSLPGELKEFEREAGEKGHSLVNLIVENEVMASFALADVVREESKQAVEKLHASGLEVVLLTGDSLPVARTVAEELGIDQYFAEVLPEDKDKKVAELQRTGKKVAMVGDGVNDAPALTRQCGHCNWQRHGCGCRIGRDHPGEEQPPGCGENIPAEPGQLPQDGPEFGLGDRLQRDCNSIGGRRAGAVWILALTGIGCGPHVTQHRDRSHQRTAAAPYQFQPIAEIRKCKCPGIG